MLCILLQAKFVPSLNAPARRERIRCINEENKVRSEFGPPPESSLPHTTTTGHLCEPTVVGPPWPGWQPSKPLPQQQEDDRRTQQAQAAAIVTCCKACATTTCSPTHTPWPWHPPSTCYRAATSPTPTAAAVPAPRHITGPSVSRIPSTTQRRRWCTGRGRRACGCERGWVALAHLGPALALR